MSRIGGCRAAGRMSYRLVLQPHEARPAQQESALCRASVFVMGQQRELSSLPSHSPLQLPRHPRQSLRRSTSAHRSSGRQGCCCWRTPRPRHRLPRLPQYEPVHQHRFSSSLPSWAQQVRCWTCVSIPYSVDRWMLTKSEPRNQKFQGGQKWPRKIHLNYRPHTFPSTMTQIPPQEVPVDHEVEYEVLPEHRPNPKVAVVVAGAAVS